MASTQIPIGRQVNLSSPINQPQVPPSSLACIVCAATYAVAAAVTCGVLLSAAVVGFFIYYKRKQNPPPAVEIILKDEEKKTAAADLASLDDGGVQPNTTRLGWKVYDNPLNRESKSPRVVDNPLFDSGSA